MKRVKKLIILLVVAFLLTGCTVEYDLTINPDGTVNEKVVAEEITNRMKSKTGINEKQSVKYLYQMFKRKKLNTFLSQKKDGEKTVATVTGSHKSVKAYTENFESDIVPEASYTEKDGIVTLTLKQEDVLSSNTSTGYVYDKITVNIKVPYKVVDNNADAVRRTLYTWHIDKDKKVKTIKISYNKNELLNTKTFTFGSIKFNVRYEFLTIGSIIFIVAVIALFVYINNKKNNKV